MILRKQLSLTFRSALLRAGHCCLAAALATSACVQAGASHDDGSGGSGTGGSDRPHDGSGGSGAGGSGLGGATGTGGAVTGGTGGRSGTGGAPGLGGATGGLGGFTGNLPPLVREFTDDFEDGSFLTPPVKWLSTVRSDGDMANWTIATDDTKVASQSLAAAESELVSGDYRWQDASIEAKVKLLTPDARAGVCVRYKNVDNKYCVYLEQLVDEAGVIGWTMELRMRSDLGGASSLPKVRNKDRPTPIAASVTGWNTVKLEVHGTQYTASLNGVVAFEFSDPANLVTTGGVALATNNGGIAKFDDAHAVPF